MATMTTSTDVNLRECFFSPDSRCPCDLKLTPLSDLLIPPKNANYFPGCKSVLQLVLLKGDHFEEEKFDPSKTFICKQHHHHYTKECQIGQVRKCTACKPVFGKKSSQKSKSCLKNVNREEAYVLFKKHKVTSSYGSVICYACARELQNTMKSGNLFPAEKLIWLDKFSSQKEISNADAEEGDSSSDFSLPLSAQSDDSAKLCQRKRKIRNWNVSQNC